MIGCGGGSTASPDAPVAHCTPASFADLTPTVLLAPAEEVAVPTTAAFTLAGMSGALFECDASFANPQRIDLGLYNISSPYVTPEGDELFYTPAIEPLELHTAHRVAPAQWVDMHDGPPGAYAGRPSALPTRRVFVDTNGVGLTWQEYEASSAGWTPVGAPYDLRAMLGPDQHGAQLSLSDDGLLLLFVNASSAGAELRYALRPSLADRFDSSVVLFDGEHLDAALSADCKSLITIGPQQTGSAIVRFAQP